MCAVPSMTTSSQSQVSGAWVTLSIVSPNGTDTYKWYKGTSGDTSTLIGDSGTSPAISVNPTQTTNYWVRATGAQCFGDSATTPVYICYPTVTGQPQNASITQGQTAHLSVTATGTPTLTYQWYTGTPSSPVGISGATASSVDVTPSATTTYYVRVTSTVGAVCGTNSSVATVTVCQLPAITFISAGANVYPGNTAGLSVTTTGTNLTYQWYAGQSGDTTHPVFTNTPTPSFTASQSAYYWVKVSNSCGSVNSAAVLNSIYPQTYGPTNVSIPSGSHTTLTVYATGTFLTYQWYFGDFGHPIAGATGASYTTPNLTVGTIYYVAVKSGTATVNPSAVVSMCTGPLLDSAYAQAYSGSCWYVVAVVNYQDSANVTYTWFKGASGDTSQPIGAYSYYAPVCPTVQTSYWCRITFADGSCYTDTQTLTVH
jgi:hypothetical protein